MLIRPPRAAFSTILVLILLIFSWSYFKSAGYVPDAIWEHERGRLGATGPDVGEDVSTGQVQDNGIQRPNAGQVAKKPPGKGEDRTSRPHWDMNDGDKSLAWKPKPEGYNYTRILVVPKTKEEDVKWIEEQLPGLQTAIYEVDNPKAEYHVPKNKVCHTP